MFLDKLCGASNQFFDKLMFRAERAIRISCGDASEMFLEDNCSFTAKWYLNNFYHSFSGVVSTWWSSSSHSSS